jgi:hypothetical protein
VPVDLISRILSSTKNNDLKLLNLSKTNVW